MARIRPQIFLAVLILGLIALYGVRVGETPVVVGCVTGIVALGKDILAADNGD